MKTSLPVFLSLFCVNAFGAETTAKAVDPLSAETLTRVFGSLGLILVAIFALVWVLRRSGAVARGRGGKMQVIDVLSLGQKERLVLVAVGGQQLVLGVAPGRVESVHVLDAPYVETNTPVVGGKFADALRRVHAGHGSTESEAKNNA